MATGLNAPAFQRLLARLDADPARAGERYEDLRRTLVRFFEWRGAPFPEDHADETFDRVARRLDEGIAIENLGGYCYKVARLIFLETLKDPDTRRTDLDMAPPLAAPDDQHAATAKEARLGCLDQCLRALPAEHREVILTYYRDEKRARIDAGGIWRRAWGSGSRRWPTARSDCATSSNDASTPASTGQRHDRRLPTLFSEKSQGDQGDQGDNSSRRSRVPRVVCHGPPRVETP